MTARSKIIGLTRQIDQTDEAETQLIEEQVPSEPDLADEYLHVENYASEEEFVETPGARWTAYVLPTFLCLAALGWTVAFGWTFATEITAAPAPERMVALTSMWAMPVSLLALIWLLALRHSRAEASRFGDVALTLRNESAELERRMRTVNEEIALAREFLAHNARELETLGRQSAQNLVEAAQSLTSALADSDEKAKTLETVSNAATSNLDQLRKHLPVVTSAAKDVTNQIGSAGNNAQMQIRGMISALEQAGTAGEVANQNIVEAERRLTEFAARLDAVSESTASKVQAVSDNAYQKAVETASLLETASRNIVAEIGHNASEVDRMIGDSKTRIEESIALFRESIASLSLHGEEEQQRIARIVSEITSYIDSSAKRISDIDKSATEQTARLAFAVSALGESTRDVGSALDENHDKTGRLIDRSDRLLETLMQATHELEATLPAAMAQTDRSIDAAAAQLNKANAQAAALNRLSDDILARTQSIEHLIAAQRQAVADLLAESDSNFAARQEQAEALAGALAATRVLIDELTDSADNKLRLSLSRVDEATREAAENSRRIVYEELAQVGERLTEQNRAALAAAVDQQVRGVGETVQQAIQRNLELSATSTAQLSAQLQQLEEMTVNLEKRIADSKDGFDGIEHDNFARRMVLLTESLNSTAIDVAKILSNEVTDTAWAAYLKGDRGVFTRRAVRLLDAGEARAIATHYGEDAEFREHVNRYIHDFEAMMRVLLSTRDGNAIGVTLLSSDVGKLYVALAQAIERLRN
jgi:hypothetical protein